MRNFFLGVLFAGLVAFAFWPLPGDEQVGPFLHCYTVHTVQQWENVDSIAKMYKPYNKEYSSTLDFAVAINALNDFSVQPGKQIKIPLTQKIK